MDTSTNRVDTHLTGDAADIELVAVVVGGSIAGPHVLVSDGPGLSLPSGPLLSGHRSLQLALRSWVENQTGLSLGFVEQLYTFADVDRSDRDSHRTLSVSYLALTCLPTATSEWFRWYDAFPWEDRRSTDQLAPELVDRLRSWAGKDSTGTRLMRVQILFGWDGRPWLPELALQRYEALYEAGLVAESGQEPVAGTGVPMVRDHRRIVATGVSRLRSKIQYRPVIFEAMPDLFTLGELQLTVEAIAGQVGHKQNFRRLVMSQQLVEPTGKTTRGTGGRPAELFRFRSQVTDERSVIGTKLPRVR